jgi:hypothetical protein
MVIEYGPLAAAGHRLQGEALDQNEWMKDELAKPAYAGIELVATVYGDDGDEKSYNDGSFSSRILTRVGLLLSQSGFTGKALGCSHLKGFPLQKAVSISAARSKVPQHQGQVDIFLVDEVAHRYRLRSRMVGVPARVGNRRGVDDLGAGDGGG